MSRRAISVDTAGQESDDQFSIGDFVVHVNGLVVPRAANIAFEQGDALGQKLSVMDKGIQFAVGDWMNMMEERFGERAAQAIDSTRWTEKTISIYRWVAVSVPFANRMMDHGLSFKHHMVVARLSHRLQKEWLKKAVNEDEGIPWSVARLQAALAEGEDLPVVGWRLLVTCDSPEDRAKIKDMLEGRGKACKEIDKRARKKKGAEEEKKK